MIRLIKHADNSNINLAINMINDNIIDHIYEEIQNDFINFLSEMLQYTDEIEIRLLDFRKENTNFQKILNIYCTPIINKYHLDKYAIIDLYDHICQLIYKKYNLDIINKLNKKLKIIQINTNDKYNFTINANKIQVALYKEIKRFIKDNINILYKCHYANITYLNLSDIFNVCLRHNWRTLNNISPVEKRLILQNTFDKYKLELQYYIDNYIKTNKSANIEDKLYYMLNEYINNNFYKIFLKFDLEKDNENNMFIHSWTDENDDLEYDYLLNYLLAHKQEITSQLQYNLSNKQWYKLITKYINNSVILDKIRKYIGYKNDKIRNTRALDLLQLQDDDKIGVKDSTSIDYDITNDYVRTSPIIIINDINTNKDFVFIGPKGFAHSTYIEEKLKDDMAAKNIIANDYKMGYGYLLKNIAFVDEHGDNFLIGYSLEDEVNILKNDPRIKKIYTTPGHPHPNPGTPAPITRLAKLIYTEFI